MDRFIEMLKALTELVLVLLVAYLTLG
jgi:hypothetical protein